MNGPQGATEKIWFHARSHTATLMAWWLARDAEDAEKTDKSWSFPHRKLLISLLPGIKEPFSPGTQDILADFVEIPLRLERSGEGIKNLNMRCFKELIAFRIRSFVFPCVPCDLSTFA
jgi:hypothetical protein